MKHKTSVKIIRIIGILLTTALCFTAMGKLDCFPLIELILIIIFLIAIGPADYVDFGKFKAAFPYTIRPGDWHEDAGIVTLNSISKNVTVRKYENTGKKTVTTDRHTYRSGNKIYTRSRSSTYHYRAEAYYFEFESEDEARMAEREIGEMYTDEGSGLKTDLCRYKSELVVYRVKNVGSGKDEVEKLATSGTLFKSQETPSLNVVMIYKSIIYCVSLMLLLMISSAMAYTFDFTSPVYLSALVGAFAVIAYAVYVNRNNTSKSDKTLMVIIAASIIRLACAAVWLGDFHTVEYLILLTAVLLGGIHMAYKRAYENYLSDIS